jgi:hypothetical protein
MELHCAVHELSLRIAEDGVDAHRGAVAAVLLLAEAGGAPPAVLGVLADPEAPAVARQRAFGRAAAFLPRSGATGSTRLPEIDLQVVASSR